MLIEATTYDELYRNFRWDIPARKSATAETGAAGMKDMGKVIGVLRAKFAGQMDFGKASGMVKAALSS